MDDAGGHIESHDEEIAYCDREIGRLLDHYDSLGLAENALIIFTADHGELEQLAWESGLHGVEAAALIELIAADPDPAGVSREYAADKQLEHPRLRPDVDPRLLEMLRGLGYVE